MIEVSQPYELVVRVRDANRLRVDYLVAVGSRVSPVEPPPPPTSVLYGAWDVTGTPVVCEYGSWHHEGAEIEPMYAAWS